MQNPSKSQSLRTFLLPAILLLGAILRIYRLGYKPFWHDEGVTWYIGNGILTSDAHPGFYFYFLRIFLTLFGNDEFAGRLFSAVVGVLFLWILYLFTKNIADRRTALIATLFAAISPFYVDVSQEMRMYALISLETVLMFFFFWKIRTKPERGEKILYWAGLFITSLAGVYTHSLVLFQLIFLSLIFFFMNIRGSFKRIFYWAAMMLVVGLAYLPYLQRVFGAEKQRKHIWVEFDLHNMLLNVSLIIKSVFTFIIGNILNLTYMSLSGLKTGQKLLFIVIVVLFTFSIVWLTRRTFGQLKKPDRITHRSGFIFAGMICLLNLVLFMILEVSLPRHMITLFIPFIILMAFYIAEMAKKGQIISLILLGAISTASLIHDYRSPISAAESVNYREVAAYLEQNVADEDIVILESIRNQFYTLLYYSSNVGCPIRYTNVGKYPSDAYQIDKKYGPPSPIVRDPIALLNGLTEDYPRVFWLSHKDMQKRTLGATGFQLESTIDFGPELSIYIFR